MKTTNETIANEQKEEVNQSWTRRHFLKVSGLSAVGLVACGENPARVSETTRRIYLSNPPDEVPNPKDLSDVIVRRLTKGSYELIVDIPTTLSQSLVIPKNIDLTVTRDGRIKLDNNSLRIEGIFRAGWTPVFEFKEGKDSTPATVWKEGTKGKEGRFELARQQVVFGQGSTERVVASWFGTRANGSSPKPDDDHPALQRAILASREVRRLFIPAGNYWLKNTLLLGPPYVEEGLNGLLVEGAVERAHVEGNTAETTRLFLDPAITDRPAINIGRVSDVILRNLVIYGGNTQSSKTIYKGETDVKKQKPIQFPPTLTSYIDRNYNHGRYSPYAAVVVDGYSGKKPVGDGASTRAYAEDLNWGLKYQERKDFLPKNVLIDNVRIERFVLGVAVVPLGLELDKERYQGRESGVVFKRCFLSDCAVGIAVGTSKAFKSHLRDSSLELMYAAVDSSTFGEQTGADLHCSYNRYRGCRLVYNMPEVSTGTCLLSGESAHDIVRIGSFGDLGVTGNITRAVLTSCRYAFTTKVGSSHLLSTKSAITFLGCRFYFEGPGIEMFCSPAELSSSRLTFQSCSFEANGDVFPQVFTTQYTEKTQLQFRNSAIQHANGQESVVQHVLDDNQTVLIFEKQSNYKDKDSGKEVQIYDLDASQPLRVPIHFNARSLQVMPRPLDPRSRYQNKTWQFRFHGSLNPFVLLRKNAVVTEEWSSGDDGGRQDVTFALLHADELQPTDRIYWAILAPEEDEVKTPGITAMLPMLRILNPAKDIRVVEENGTRYQEVRASLPAYLKRDTKAEQEVSLGATTAYMNRAFVVPSTDFRDLQRPNNPLRRPEESLDPTKQGFKRFYQSNLAVLVNTNEKNDGKGMFQAGSVEVKEVRGVHLLEVGDFVNNDYVPEGTRIKSIQINSTSKASEREFHSSGVITLTQPARKTSTERASVLLLEAVSP